MRAVLSINEVNAVLRAITNEPEMRERSVVRLSVTEYRYGTRCGARACRASLHRINSHWPSDILEFLLSEIGEPFLQAVTYLAVGVLGKTDTARISNAFEARGNVDAIAHQVAVALLDYIAQVSMARSAAIIPSMTRRIVTVQAR